MLALVATLFAGALPADAAAYTATSQQTIPFSAVYPPSPCTEEPIRVSGEAHVLGHITFAEDGSSRFVLHSNLQGARGEGLESGRQYQVITTNNNTAYFGQALPIVITERLTVRIVGAGPGNNFALTMLLHITVSATGELTASQESFTVECR